jgi:hypothetical protein
MSRLRVDKYIGTEHEKSFTVPGLLIDFAVRVLPRSALASLSKQGIDIAAIAAAKRRHGTYSSSIEVHEHGVKKTVSASLVN